MYSLHYKYLYVVLRERRTGNRGGEYTYKGRDILKRTFLNYNDRATEFIRLPIVIYTIHKCYSPISQDYYCKVLNYENYCEPFSLRRSQRCLVWGVSVHFPNIILFKLHY